MLESHIHRKKRRGRPMAINVARANHKRSAIRAPIEHIFAYQKDKMGLFIRTIHLARARTKIDFANLLYNMKRLTWLARTAALA